MRARLLLLGVALCAVWRPAAAAVEITGNGFVIRHQAVIGASPARVYDSLLGRVGDWWNPAHTYSGESRNLSIEARAGGCFCERLPDGGGIEHLRVVYLRPAQVVRFSGALGPLGASGLAGAMTWKLTPEGSGTKVELSYSVGGYMEGGFAKIAPLAEAMLAEQLQRLAAFVETGAPAR